MIGNREGWLLSGLLYRKCNHPPKTPNLFVAQVSLYQWEESFCGIGSLDSVAGVSKIGQNAVLLAIFDRATGSSESVCLAAANGDLNCLCTCCRIDLQSHIKGHGCSFTTKQALKIPFFIA